ncbi:Flp pilus assembly protein CpaB [Erythrobacter crassostreae]|uniref:Flp pilus assembly protein CpaB n=1 Tax=Erythrobacter crassostreae TaxID=2828328 RepID=A0A9X1F2U1_9SPHN|nr:Flp pilus assembly protein CpaB [Erythrobacter crassostrea]MBV7259257.1 Flp pilus assembly protein CpaB [Erythrobacter crassostrea]
MDRKKLVLLLGALIIAVGTAFAARSMFAEGAAPEVLAAPVPEGPKVLVANRGLPAGTIITADALGYQQWPEELVQDAYFIEGESDVNQLIGTVVRLPVTAGEPVTQGSLVSPGDRGFLAAALGAGMRAVTVPVSARTGVAGFVFPGDRVDLLLTQKYENKVTDVDFEGAETILRNLRVLATDQSTETVTNEEGKTVVRAFRTVTLEVTPKLAEKIAVAQTMGTLSLVLRSLADNQAELDRAIANGDIKIPEGASPEEEERLLRAAVTRPVDGKQTYQTAFDVSKFRRQEEAKAKAQLQAMKPTPPAIGVSSSASGAPVRSGPTVRVTRGKATSEVPVSTARGANNSSLRRSSSNGGPTPQLVR